MSKSLTLLTFLIVSAAIYGQNGHVEVVQDNRVNALVEKQSAVIPPEVRPQIDGYRIQLFFDSDKAKVNDAKSRFATKFSKVDTYITYNAPNFFLKAGDFRTKLEAERIRSQIEAEFPTSFVIREKIFLPRLEKEELAD